MTAAKFSFRSNFGIEILQNRVFVAGGYGGAIGTISFAESYDFLKNQWCEMPQLSLRRSALYLTRIDNSDIIEDFLKGPLP